MIKKLVLSSVLAVCFIGCAESFGGSGTSDAESEQSYASRKAEKITDRATRKIENKVENKVEEKVDGFVNKLMDKVF